MDREKIAKFARELEAKGVDLHEFAKQCLTADGWTLEEAQEAADLSQAALIKKKKELEK